MSGSTNKVPVADLFLKIAPTGLSPVLVKMQSGTLEPEKMTLNCELHSNSFQYVAKTLPPRSESFIALPVDCTGIRSAGIEQ